MLQFLQNAIERRSVVAKHLDRLVFIYQNFLEHLLMPHTVPAMKSSYHLFLPAIANIECTQ